MKIKKFNRNWKNIIFANLIYKKSKNILILFLKKNEGDYFDENGQSIKKL